MPTCMYSSCPTACAYMHVHVGCAGLTLECPVKSSTSTDEGKLSHCTAGMCVGVRKAGSTGHTQSATIPIFDRDKVYLLCSEK